MKQYGDFLFTSQVLKVYNEVRMNPEDVEWRLEVARLLQLLFCKDDIILKLNVDNDTGCPFNLDNFQIAVTFLLFGIFPIGKNICVIKIWRFCCIQWKFTILIQFLKFIDFYGFYGKHVKTGKKYFWGTGLHPLPFGLEK